MKINILETDKQMVAILSGEMDTAAALEAETTLAPLSESHGKEILIDCTDLEYISSSGLRVLLGVLKKAKSVGSRVVLRNVNEVILEVLELTGFVSLFDFEK